MNTTIKIMGQINGNHTLANSLSSNGLLEKKKGMFNSIILIYKSKKDAVNALSKAYQVLRSEEPTIVGRIGGINYRRGEALNYDASKAVIC